MPGMRLLLHARNGLLAAACPDQLSIDCAFRRGRLVCCAVHLSHRVRYGRLAVDHSLTGADWLLGESLHEDGVVDVGPVAASRVARRLRGKRTELVPLVN